MSDPAATSDIPQMAEIPARKRRGAWARGLLALALALLAATAAAFTGLAAADGATGLKLWALAAGAVFAFAGLAAIFLWLAGLLHFGSYSKQRAFYDAVLDSCGDAFVVTNRRGRPIYANSAYRALLKNAGVSRSIPSAKQSRARLA